MISSQLPKYILGESQLSYLPILLLIESRAANNLHVTRSNVTHFAPSFNGSLFIMLFLRYNLPHSPAAIDPSEPFETSNTRNLIFPGKPNASASSYLGRYLVTCRTSVCSANISRYNPLSKPTAWAPGRKCTKFDTDIFRVLFMFTFCFLFALTGGEAPTALRRRSLRNWFLGTTRSTTFTRQLTDWAPVSQWYKPRSRACRTSQLHTQSTRLHPHDGRWEICVTTTMHRRSHPRISAQPRYPKAYQTIICWLMCEEERETVYFTTPLCKIFFALRTLSEQKKTDHHRLGAILEKHEPKSFQGDILHTDGRETSGNLTDRPLVTSLPPSRSASIKVVQPASQPQLPYQVWNPFLEGG